MYTRCPECDTVFRIDREALDAAGGEVRCGRCSGIFDARASLIEKPPESDEGQQATDDKRMEETKSVEGRAASHAEESDDEAVVEPTSGDQADEDAMLEFSLPEDRWGEVFIEDELSSVARDRSSFTESEFGPGGVGDDEITMPRDEPPDDPPTNTSAEAPLAFDDENDSGILVEESDDSEIELYFGSTFPGSLRETVVVEARAAGIEPATSEARNELPDADERFYGEPVQQAKAPTPVSRRGRLFWGVASGILLAGAFVQLVHLNRNDWAALPWAGDVIAGAYRMVGMALDPRWNRDEYRVVAAAAAAESQQSGTLRIHATLANTAERAQPYPLIRLTLTDRWGDGISERVFEPREYVGESVEAVGLLDPGKPVEASIAVVDPGEDAFGFELDVCLRDAQRRVRCSDRE